MISAETNVKSKVEPHIEFENLGLNFMDETWDSIIVQLESVHKTQSGHMYSPENWTSEWWRHNGNEVKA